MTPTARVWTVAVAVVAVMFTSWVLGGILLIVLAVQAGVSPTDANALTLLSKSPENLPMFIALQATVTLGVTIAVALLSPEGARQRLGLHRSTNVALYGATALGAFCASAAVNQFLIAISKGASDSMAALNTSMQAPTGTEVFFGVTLGVTVLAPVGEELFFRGVVQRRIIARFGAVVGIAVGTILFALAHFDLVHSTLMIFTGAFLGVAAYRSGSTWVPLVGHVVNNLLVLIMTRTIGDITVTHLTRGLMSFGYAVVAISCMALVWRLTRRSSC